MKKLIMLTFAIGGLLSGCVVYDTPHRDADVHRDDHDHNGPNRPDRDRDHDGVPNRDDSSPDDPRRN